MPSEIETPKWLVVGLGNPGPEYERTRHNIGFMLIDRLAAGSRIQVRREECRALIGAGLLEGRPAELAKPQTFMNLSGEAVSCLLKKNGRGGARLMVISDDLALPFGRIRLRTRGSHGGQNGLRSIIDRLGTEDFIRLRVGIGPEHPVENARSFVLQRFSASEAAELDRVLERAANAAIAAVRDGMEKAMAEFNG
jgi:peptidyl-tRNA hydrolase, PTH1 family